MEGKVISFQQYFQREIHKKTKHIMDGLSIFAPENHRFHNELTENVIASIKRYDKNNYPMIYRKKAEIINIKEHLNDGKRK